MNDAENKSPIIGRRKIDIPIVPPEDGERERIFQQISTRIDAGDEAYQIPEEKEIKDFAQSSEEFEEKRTAYVKENIEYWEGKIRRRIEAVNIDFANSISTPSSKVLRRAAELLAHAELGVKLVNERYNPDLYPDQEHYEILLLNDQTGQDFLEADLFQYHHNPILKWQSGISIHLQWLLHVAEHFEWYKNYLDVHPEHRLGPLRFENLEDVFLFEAIEEASHNIYLNYGKNWNSNRQKPQSGKFYYAEDWEFQALKTMYFFAKKYVPKYAQLYKDHLIEMTKYRKKK